MREGVGGRWRHRVTVAALAGLAVAGCQTENPRFDVDDLKQDGAADRPADQAPPADAAPDVVAEVSGPDVGGEVPPDVAMDAGVDAGPDASVPDRSPDLTPDVARDTVPDLAPDRAPDVGWTCSPPVAGACSSTCILCSSACRPKPFGCAVLIRSQTADPCGYDSAAHGCRGLGVAFSDLTICTIGIIRRQLELEQEACNTALFQRLGREGCQEYIDKRRQPGLNPNAPIVVAYIREVFAGDGTKVPNLQYHVDDTTCGRLGIPGSAP